MFHFVFDLNHFKPVTEDYVPLFPRLGVMWWARQRALESELLLAAQTGADCAGRWV
ncbi:MAG: hypothetical protein Q8M05_19560 [Rhodoferax sp.]|nr:hypothetical protein [Rhodoferax sp.]MDP1531567.1 hypothetical protein [Rhodoferax sp.]